ncbi:sialidase family protein [Flavisolibacter nicotianae]|uniref:sialidase family protein n=1 Tax=Flavisolibacter nicotianae TaxID=2364882 RepID=UPI000EACF92A|nr:sialidase family protein [Flavisolibacter nicotianae]
MKHLFTLLFLCSAVFFARGQSSWKIVHSELVVARPPFQACHASTLVELPSGDLLVSFFAGTREAAKDVSIWLAAKREGRWTRPFVVATGIINDTLRYPCWNPVLFQAKEGTLFLFYKVGPSPREWWGMVRTSTNGGKTWSRPRKLPRGILGPIKNKPVQLADGTILSPSSVETEAAWKVYMERSANGGKTWSRVPVDTASAFRVIQPGILLHADKSVQIVCRSDQDRVVTAWSSDNGKTWTKFAKLDLPNPNSGIDAVTLKNKLQMIVYNPTVRGKDWWNNRGKLNVAVSVDGIKWKDVVVLENGSSEEYSYPAIIQAKDGRVHITYTNDRKNIRHVILEEDRKRPTGQ